MCVNAGVDTVFWTFLEKMPGFIRDFGYDMIHSYMYVPKPNVLKTAGKNQPIRVQNMGSTDNQATRSNDGVSRRNRSLDNGQKSEEDETSGKNGFITASIRNASVSVPGRGHLENGSVKHETSQREHKIDHHAQKLANRSGVRLLFALAGVAKFVGKMSNIGGHEDDGDDRGGKKTN